MRLIPRQEKFYRFFNRQAELSLEAATLLCEAVSPGGRTVGAAAARIFELEDAGDAVVLEAIRLLRQTFITPIDPEDVHRMIERQDKLLDDIEECAFRLTAYQLDPIPPPVAALAELALEACRALASATQALESGSSIQEHLSTVSHMEKQADQVLRDAEVALFAAERDPIFLLKQKEILEWLEGITDRCDDIGDVLENIVVKNA